MEKTDENKSKSYLVQRISTAIQRGNAAGISSAMPPDNADLQPIIYLRVIYLFNKQHSFLNPQNMYRPTFKTFHILITF